MQAALYKIPILIGLTILSVALEYSLIRFWKKRAYSFDSKEALVSGFIFLLQALETAAAAGLIVYVYSWARQHTFFTLPSVPWFIWFPPGLLLSEFLYYWTHRYLHRVRWGWMNHAAHHTPKFYNFSMAFRVGPGVYICLIAFFPLSLIFLGLQAEWVGILVSVNKLYQFWIHTELDPRFGFLEKIFVMPTHHRVHHGKNPEYIDKNYGGTFIFFDKMFGTFQTEDPKIKIEYGVTENLDPQNAIQSTFGAWMNLYRDFKKFPGLKNKLRLLYKNPGWAPEGFEPSRSNQEKAS